MGADHRKPAVAFVVLALIAVALVGSQRAEAQHGRLLAAVIAVGGQAESIRGLLPDPPADAEQADRHHVAALGPMFPTLPGGDEHGATPETTPSLDVTTVPGAPTDHGAPVRTSVQGTPTDRGVPDRTSAQGAATTERGAGSETGAEPGTRAHRRAAQVAERARQGRRHGLATAPEARRKGIERRVVARAPQFPPLAGRGRAWESHAQPRPLIGKAAPSRSRTQGHPWSRGHGKKLGLIGEVPDKVRGQAGRGHDKLYAHAGQAHGKKPGHAGQGHGKKRGHAGRGPGSRRGR